MNFKLIIGLGNDDPQYRNTYHNVGHLFIDYLTEHYPALRAEKTAGYMNEAGISVRNAMKKSSAAPEQTLIVHDESDVLLGEYRISTARGAAGHKGVQNVFDVTHANTFTRLRIGIRPRTADQHGRDTDSAGKIPRESASRERSARRMKAEEFVLKNISAADQKQLAGVYDRAATELFGTPDV